VIADTAISVRGDSDLDVFAWIGRVLTNFAVAEQAIGSLCFKLDLPVSNGSLNSMADLRERLRKSADRRCVALEKRIERWNSNRPLRHLLAHATVTRLTDASGDLVAVTRRLLLEAPDVTPDRTWTSDQRRELLRQATNDGRSIRDLVSGILNDPATLAKLRR
jgi:hypothetical protein